MQSESNLLVAPTADLISAAEAVALVPGRADGKKVHPETIRRWCREGIRQGVRLKSVQVGGRCYTTRTDLANFLAACSLTGGNAPTLAP